MNQRRSVALVVAALLTAACVDFDELDRCFGGACTGGAMPDGGMGGSALCEADNIAPPPPLSTTVTALQPSADGLEATMTAVFSPSPDPPTDSTTNQTFIVSYAYAGGEHAGQMTVNSSPVIFTLPTAPAEQECFVCVQSQDSCGNIDLTTPGTCAGYFLPPAP